MTVGNLMALLENMDDRAEINCVAIEEYCDGKKIATVNVEYIDARISVRDDNKMDVEFCVCTDRGMRLFIEK